MPIFGPNIEKIKEKKDIEGLMEQIRNPTPNIRVGAVEALKEINDQETIKRLSAMLSLDLLSKIDDETKIETIALICGRATHNFLVPALSCNVDRAKAVEKVQRKLPLEFVRESLITTSIEKENNPLVRWYALLALVELGEKNNKILDALINSSENLTIDFVQPSEESSLGFWRALLTLSIREETLRALSCFRENPVAKNAIIDALEGHFLAGRSGEPWLHHELFALGALGDPTIRKHLEYWTMQGSTEVRKRARVALEFFGRATYDEIKEKCK